MVIPIEIIVWVLGAIFALLIAGISILINVLAKNTEAFKKIEISLAQMTTADSYEEKACNSRHSYIDSKIAEHNSKIEAHGLIIQEHEYKLKEIMMS